MHHTSRFFVFYTKQKINLTWPKCCNDLNTHKKNELESTFIEIFNPRKSNIIVGVIAII